MGVIPWRHGRAGAHLECALWPNIAAGPSIAPQLPAEYEVCQRGRAGGGTAPDRKRERLAWRAGCFKTLSAGARFFSPWIGFGRSASR